MAQRFSPDKLAKMRERRGMTQVDVGMATGLNPESISRLERGHRRPTRVTLGALARALECEIVELLEEQEPADLPTELGAETDAWIARTLATAPAHMSEDVARRVSAALFGKASA